MGKWKWLISLGTTTTAAVSTPITVVKVLMDKNFDIDANSVNVAFKKDSYVKGQKFKKNIAVINDLNEIYGDGFFDENEEIDDEQMEELEEMIEELEEVAEELEEISEDSWLNLDEVMELIDTFNDVMETLNDIKDAIKNEGSGKSNQNKSPNKSNQNKSPNKSNQNKSPGKSKSNRFKNTFKNGFNGRTNVSGLSGGGPAGGLLTAAGGFLTAAGGLLVGAAGGFLTAAGGLLVGAAGGILGALLGGISDLFSGSDSNESDMRKWVINRIKKLASDEKISEDSNEQKNINSNENILINLNILMDIDVTSLKKVEDFKEKIVTELRKQNNFKTLEAYKIEIKKSDGITELTDNDLAEGSIAVKVKVVPAGQTEFTGEKNLIVTWIQKTINLSGLEDIIICGSIKTIEDFKEKIIVELKKQNNFQTLEANKIKIKNANGITDIMLSDIVEGKITIKLKVLPAGQTEFTGEKNLIVLTDEANKIRKKKSSSYHLPTYWRKNLSDLEDISVRSRKNVEDFKATILYALKQQEDFEKLEANKIEIKKSDGVTELTDNDLVEGSITVKIKVVSAGQTEFVGAKSVKIYWTEHYVSHQVQTNEIRKEKGLSHHFSQARLWKNLENLPRKLYLTTLKNVEDFKARVLEELKWQSNFDTLEANKIEIKKSDGVTDLTTSDLVAGKIRIKIIAANGQTEFVGAKSVKIYWTEHYASY